MAIFGHHCITFQLNSFKFKVKHRSLTLSSYWAIFAGIFFFERANHNYCRMLSLNPKIWEYIVINITTVTGIFVPMKSIFFVFSFCRTKIKNFLFHFLRKNCPHYLLWFSKKLRENVFRMCERNISK